MAVQIPIISDFDGTGVNKAIAQFKQLETTGQKAQFALKKAAVPAAAAIAGITAGLVDATKAAIDDAAAQNELARQLTISTGATDKQIASVEDWISVQGRLLGVADDDLRPALAKLARATEDITEAQKAAKLAMDISAATGKDLGTVTTALEKAYGGNLTALQKLDPSLRDAIKGGASLDDVFQTLSKTFGGAASEAADTAQGRFKRLGLALSETKESIGSALLPVVEAILPTLQKFGDWAQKHPDAFLAIAAAIGAVSVSILAVNAAMALNPFTAIAAGVALVVTGLVIAYKKFEWFRNGVNDVVNGLIGYFETIANGWIHVINALIRAWNVIPGHRDLSTLGTISLGRVGEDTQTNNRSAVPMMAAGGVVTAPTLAMIGEAGPEAVIPLDRLGSMGQPSQVTINVNGGDPQAVVDTITRWYRQNGSAVAWMA